MSHSFATAANVSRGNAHNHATGDGAAIPAGGLATDAVETAKIKDANVTTAKILDANVTTAKLATGVLQAGKNLLHNGSFRVAQRGAGPFTAATTPLNSDGNILLDRWRLLSDGNDIADISQSTVTLASGQIKPCILIDIETANKQVGKFQMLEAKDVQHLLASEAEKVSLSFKAVVSNTRIGTVRAAIVSLAGVAADTYSHPVGAWNAGANFTPAANWTIEGSAQFTFSDTNELICELEDVILDNDGAVNLGVIIWIDDETTSAGDTLKIYDVQLERGAVATEFEIRPAAVDLLLCERYFYALRDIFGAMCGKYATKYIGCYGQKPPIPMLKTPTALHHNITGWGTSPTAYQMGANIIRTNAPATISGALSIDHYSTNPQCVGFYLTAGTSFNPTDGDILYLMLGSSAFIGFSAEI